MQKALCSSLLLFCSSFLFLFLHSLLPLFSLITHSPCILLFSLRSSFLFFPFSFLHSRIIHLSCISKEKASSFSSSLLCSALLSSLLFFLFLYLSPLLYSPLIFSLHFSSLLSSFLVLVSLSLLFSSHPFFPDLAFFVPFFIIFLSILSLFTFSARTLSSAERAYGDYEMKPLFRINCTQPNAVPSLFDLATRAALSEELQQQQQQQQQHHHHHHQHQQLQQQQQPIRK